MLRKIIIVFYIVIISFVFLTGCSSKDKIISDKPVNINKETKDILIGVSVLDLVNPYYVQLVNGIKSQAENRKVKLIVLDPKSDVDKQIADIERFIELKVDAIIIAALAQNDLEVVLKKAMDMDIKVVAQATKVENCNIYVAFDEWEMGHTIGQGAGKWIKENLNGEAEVGILNYPRITQIKNREKGIRDGIAEFAPKAKVVQVEEAASPIEGKIATTKILQNHPNVKVVVGINDGGALGALAYFEELNKNPKDIFIGGIDATPEAINKIKNGSMYRCTVDINPYYSGTLDVDFAIKLIKGEIVPNRFNENAKLITKDNIK